MAAKKVYAVKEGRIPGLYATWDDCKVQTDGYPGAKFKSFTSVDEANAYLHEPIADANVGGNTNADISAKTASDTALQGPYAFVDGSFNGDTNTYGYGGFLCVNEKRIPLMGHGIEPAMASMRNVAGEICGAMAAVREAEKLHLRELTILYDYTGIENWATNQWKTNNECTKAYHDFMQSDVRSVHIKYEHVKGHSGVEGNEVADVMAKHSVGIPLTEKQQALFDTALIPAAERKKTHKLLAAFEEILQAYEESHGSQGVNDLEL